MHTYTHHFIPIHTYIHTTDHITPQYVATNLEFFVKNTPYGNGSNTHIFPDIPDIPDIPDHIPVLQDRIKKIGMVYDGSLD